MTLPKVNPFTKKPTDLPDSPSPLYSAQEIKEHFQTPADELKTAHNKLVDDLEAPTGASALGAKDGESDSTVQAVLNKLSSDKATNDRVLTAENRITGTEGRLTTAESNIGSLFSKDQSLQSEVNTSKSDITSLKANKADKTEVQAVQSQVNALVVEGDSSPAIAQALAGTEFTTLKQKLDSTDTLLAEKAKKTDIDIRDYGAKGDGVTDDSAAIINAITSNPNKTILFADGVYGTAVPIDVKTDCNIEFRNATLKAIAPMAYLMNYETSRTITNAFSLSRNKFIRGGTLDGNNMVDKILRLNKFLRFTLNNMTFKNGKKRGLTTNDVNSMSAELVANDLYFANDNADYITDNIAIENLGGDNFYTDVNIVDWTVGIKDLRNATWTRIHPWISQKVRLPDSKSYWLVGDNFTLQNCIVDSTQYGVYLESGVARINGIKSFWMAGVYDEAEATNYPVTMFKNAGTGTFYVDGAIVNSGSIAVANSVKVVDNVSSPSGVYKDIIAKGTAGVVTNIPTERVPNAAKGTFTPTLKGSTVAGSPTYTQQTGKYYKTGDVVNFTLSVIATIDATMSGALKIGGLPFTCGNLSNALNVGYFQGISNTLMAYTVANAADILIAYNTDTGFAYSDAVPLRGAQVTITVSGSYHV